MKVCYIVLTCEKYFDTRVKWQLETMFGDVLKSDIYFLGHVMDVERRLYSWGAADDYNSLPYKYMDFFKHLDIDYDWYILIDDDTYVFHTRMVQMLEMYNSSALISIGKVLEHVKDQVWGAYHSGGAGTVISRALFLKIQNLIRSKDSAKNIVMHWCADICVGLWVRSIAGSHTIDNMNFHVSRFNVLTDSLENAITFHKLECEADYNYYKSVENLSPHSDPSIYSVMYYNHGLRL